MTAGLTAITEVYTPAAAAALNARGDRLRERLAGLARSAGVPVWVTGAGSMMAVHFTPAPPRCAADADAADPLPRELLFLDLLERGIHIARRGMVALSLPVGDAECDALAEAFEVFLTERGPLLR